MSEDSIYQQSRAHLAYLSLTAAAEALPGELDHAKANKLGHTAEMPLGHHVARPREVVHGVGVETMGLEPTTPCVQSRCSTS